MATMTCSKKLDDAAENSPTGGMSPVERQAEILRSLAELTRLRPNDRSLSPDFRLQLQLLECSVQQHRLLQQVAEQQRRSAAQLETMHCQGIQCQELMQKRLGEVTQGLEQVGQRLQKQEERQSSLQESLRQAAVGDQGIGPDFCDDVALGGLSKFAHSEAPVENYKSMGVLSDMMAASVSENHEKTRLKKPKKSNSKLLDDEPWLNRIVKSQQFDLVCGFVIACNAATMGLQTNNAMTWRLNNMGLPEDPPTSEFVRVSGYFYMTFYIVELFLKLIVFRKDFFLSDMWKWNLFDSLLVLVGIYDIVVDAVTPEGGNGGTDVSWMRLLRLLKMTKLLRVVRVMRIFRVLRMMMNSIIGSMMTLMWSILMLSLMMYVFSLCFLQVIVGYLSDTPRAEIGKETLEAIKMYWGNVYQSIITLYYAVTGGADWEPLAQPVRDAGEFYYLLFLFYIAFTAFAVLNVLTGLYVDTATKISEADDECVGEELNSRKETIDLRAFFTGLDDQQEDDLQGGPILTLREFNANVDADPVKAFCRMAELAPQDCRRIFQMLDFDGSGKVSLEEFIGGCLHSKSASAALDMMALLSETKRTYLEHRGFMDFVEQQFKVVQDKIEDVSVAKTRRMSSSMALAPTAGVRSCSLGSFDPSSAK